MRPIAEYLLTTGISALVMSVVLVACGSTSAIGRQFRAWRGGKIATDLRDGKRGAAVVKAKSNP